MKIYSDFAIQRTRQIALDLFALVGILVAIVAGVLVHGAVVTLAAVGEQVEKAGSGLSTTMTNAAKVIGGIPLVGGGAKTPFERASDSGKTLAAAGVSEQDFVATSAVVLGLVVAAIPLYFVIRYLLVRRIRFTIAASKAARAAHTDGGVALFALRALVTADAGTVLKVGSDVVAGWRSDDPSVVARLAAIELRRLGVKLDSR